MVARTCAPSLRLSTTAPMFLAVAASITAPSAAAKRFAASRNSCC